MEHTESISISYANIKSKIKSNLAIMGKRCIDTNGNSHFSKVTVSSSEESLISDFVNNAMHNIVARLAELVHNYSEDDATVSFDITNTRWSISDTDNFSKAFSYSVVSFCVAQALADYYAFYFNEQSAYYTSKASLFMADIIRLCFYKQPDLGNEDFKPDVTVK